MKKKFGRTILVAESEAELDAQIQSKRFDAVYLPLVRLVAQACDDAANGAGTWVSIGTTRDKSALTLTVHTDDGPLSCYSGTLAGLAMEANELL